MQGTAALSFGDSVKYKTVPAHTGREAYLQRAGTNIFSHTAQLHKPLCLLPPSSPLLEAFYMGSWPSLSVLRHFQSQLMAHSIICLPFFCSIRDPTSDPWLCSRHPAFQDKSHTIPPPHLELQLVINHPAVKCPSAQRHLGSSPLAETFY